MTRCSIVPVLFLVRLRNTAPILILSLFLGVTLFGCGSSSDGGGGEQGPGGPLREKARVYDDWHLEHHQPHYGATLSVHFTDDSLSEVASYNDGGDSTIWTGTYLGSQAFRWAVTREPQARTNVLRMVETLHQHLKVTGKRGFIARYRAPADAPGVAPCTDRENETQNDRCHVETSGPFAGDLWRGNTSRDQYSGWFFGYMMAHELVNDEAMRATIREDMIEVMDELVATGYRIIDIDGDLTEKAPQVLPPFAASWHLMTYRVAQREQDLLAFQRFLADEAALELTSLAFFSRYTQFYGNNLGHTNYYNLARLSRDLPEHEVVVRIFEEQVHPWLHLEHNAWFEGIHQVVGDTRDPDALAQIRDDLADFRPAPNRAVGVFPPRTPPDPTSLVLFALQQAAPILGDLVGNAEPQAAVAYPTSQQCTTDFLWQRNPFRYECRAENLSFVEPGADYLAAYWLARYHGFLDLVD